MNGKISVVINTLNEEKNIERAISSIQGLADEILVCDMHSDDDTALLARKLGAKVIFTKRTGYVEPARNFAISKVEHEWILILDADEEVPEGLASKLKDIISQAGVTTHVEIPRKNIIFGHWMKASMWWPDYHIRFFKAGSVVWGDKIHSKPRAQGQGLKLPKDERWAIIHHHYSSVWQYLERMNRYSSIQARELKKEKYQFAWQDLITKPLSEFLSRFFANRGFEDGLHGLALSLLQAFSFLVVYLKVWELEEFDGRDINLDELKGIADSSGEEINYWFKYGRLSKNPLKRLIQRTKNKLT